MGETRVSLRIAAVVALFCAVPGHSVFAATNSVEQWNKIAEDAVVRSGAFQNEGLLYMGYVSAAVYDAVVAIDGGYLPYGPGVNAPAGASVDAAVTEAAYRTLVNYFPGQAAILDPLYATSLAAIADGQPKIDGQAVGHAAANLIIALRANDGRIVPIAATSSFPLLPAGPGVWRLVPPAYAAPQTPWLGQVRPFFLDRPDQWLPDPPPALSSDAWAEAFNEIESYGGAPGQSVRTPEETSIALFWTANAIRQYNRTVRDLVDALGLSLLESARLQAMVNMVGADAQIAVMNAKYHYLFWRPVTSIDPASVKLSGDGFGPVPGYDDGNPATVEQPGWRPLSATPNHPEYPAAHGSMTSAMAEVFSVFLGTTNFNLLIRGFDPAGNAGNMDATQIFRTAAELRNQIVDARVWAGLHYRFSVVSGVVLGRNVAKYDLRLAFRPLR